MFTIPAVILAADVTTVHTTGINWDSVVTITGAVVVIMTAVFGLLAKYVATKISGSINLFRIEVVDKIDVRLHDVETKLDTLNTNNPKRGRK